MKLVAIEADEIPPVKRFYVDEMSDVVVLAGPNGVGKTRLVNALLSYFRGTASKIRLRIDATCQVEVDAWQKRSLDTKLEADRALLLKTIHKSQRRGSLESAVLNFESDRRVQAIGPPPFTWNVADPWLESINWDPTMSLSARFQDTVHSLFRKGRTRREAIARRVEELLKQHQADQQPTPANLYERLETEFPDPIADFKATFSSLLAPKTLLDPDPQSRELSYSSEGSTFPLTSLSSGEQEIVSVVFDFLLRSPTDCVVIFDEPELHLHPELISRLLNTLGTIGKNNQFIYCTHSPDIITSSLDRTVVFVGPPRSDGSNQAIRVREDDETNQALRLLGQSVGIVTLGKRLVLIEGKHSSLDKQTYGAILKGQFPNLVLVPSGGREVLTSFAMLQKHVLQRTIWGVDFFMLCDRDTALPGGIEGVDPAGDKLAVLDRYHLENYFLNEDVLADIFKDMEPEGSWLRSRQAIRNLLKELAQDWVAYATALETSAYFRRQVGNISIMPKDCHGKTTQQLIEMLAIRADAEQSRIQTALANIEIKTHAQETAERIQQSLILDTEDWKSAIPGKQLLSSFASRAKIDVARLKTLFIKRAATSSPNPFENVIEIFRKFSEAA